MIAPVQEPLHHAGYRGRLAPTPSGPLHLGHARTFTIAHDRAMAAGGTLILRNEDLDRARCKPEHTAAMLADLRWLGLRWSEGPDVGGAFGPYAQSERLPTYREIWRALVVTGHLYPSPHSRTDVQRALSAPHEGDDEAPFPTALRPAVGTGADAAQPGAMNWRYRVPDGEVVRFVDCQVGEVARVAGRDFGDFLVWRRDGFPSYELAVVADDHAMAISEVVRGADLLTSTARQLLLYRALGWAPPAFYHCELVRDADGTRLAKRSDAVSLSTLRERGLTPKRVRELWAQQLSIGGQSRG